VTMAGDPAHVVALSLRQPWAHAVLHLGKDVENRRWRSRYRGRVILHASQTLDSNGLEYLRHAGFELPDDLPWGAYVGEVTVVSCVPAAECESPWGFGPWCYGLEHAVAYPSPIPGKGRLGFYPVPEEVRRMLKEALR
jgi:hypothetical protein